MARRQLPPQIKKIELSTRERGRPVVRYQLTVDVGADPETGRRKQMRRRFKTEDEARSELSRIQAEVSQGTHVHARDTTVATAIDKWLLSKHSLKPSTANGYRVVLAPVRAELGDKAVQKLTRSDLDNLISKLRAGGLASEKHRTRKPWKARTVNYMLTVLAAALEGEVKQGTLVRNVAKLVDKLPEAGERPEMKTWTPEHVEMFLESADGDSYSHAWWLALCGLRRGEISGLRWGDVDLASKALNVSTSRVSFAQTISEGVPKSKRSARTLPIPDDLVTALKAAKKRQAADRLAVGEAWKDTGYVVVDRTGNPPTPNTLTYWWKRSVEKAGVPAIRLHDARHTCATLMHLRGVPIAVIAAWMGHASAAFTLSTYAHSQDPALLQAASSAPVVTIRDTFGP
ncbi:tyrosine-type recombinase/integrase [Rhodococcus spongiicola]|uniref:Site-specific integrase n=1 Tax=Rhodococcus spongiicola TaxID=2487352 RepID=A0A3S3ZQY2_9NOCA|nr:tyrosine-type recombinase/integrase [Rhodococcus spongiicola]RVW06258.1 site-specific integrase [Rhodococcus spongiicola]